jgi:hypothetical protein
MRLGAILLVGGFLLASVGLYWVIMTSTYVCNGGAGCISGLNALLLQNMLAYMVLFGGISLLVVGSYLRFRSQQA